MRFKDDLMEYKCLCCNKITKEVWWKLKKQFVNTVKFSNNDFNKLFLLLRKGVLSMGDIIDAH